MIGNTIEVSTRSGKYRILDKVMLPIGLPNRPKIDIIVQTNYLCVGVNDNNVYVIDPLDIIKIL